MSIYYIVILISCFNLYDPNRYCETIPVLHKSRLGSEFKVSQDGKKVAFVVLGEDSGTSLYVSELDGNTIKLICNSPNRMIHLPNFTPTNDTIIYVIGNTFYIKRISDGYLDSVRCRRLIRDAAYSRDGRVMYYIRTEEVPAYYYKRDSIKAYPHKVTQYNVYSVNVDGSKRRKLSDFEYRWLTNITVSPDGRNLYLVGIGDHEYKMYKFEISAKRELAISHPKTKLSEKGTYADIEGSLFGNFLYYVAPSKPFSHPYYTYELFQQNLRTNEVKRLTNMNKLITNPCDIKSGERIYFIVDENWPCKIQPSYKLRWVEPSTGKTGEINITNIDSLARLKT